MSTDNGPGRAEYDRDRAQDSEDRDVAKGVARADYEDDQDAVRRKEFVVYAVLVLITVLAVLSVINTFLEAERAKTTGEDIRESQYLACVQNGNRLREDVRDEFVDLKQDVLIPVFEGVAATIPPGATSKVILDDSVSLMRNRIKTIDERITDVDCLEQYPPLDGQTYPDVTTPQ